MDRYLKFAVAVLVLASIPNPLESDQSQADWSANDSWSVDIRAHENGIEVMCIEGCNFFTAAMSCPDSDKECILGLAQSGVGGSSGRTFLG